MIAMLSVHPSRKTVLITPDLMRTDPAVPAKEYVDGFGNICHVIHAPVGNITLSSDFLIHNGGSADEVAPQAEQHPMENLPVDTLVYLLGSRYCETDHFVQFAWSLATIPKDGRWFKQYAATCTSIFNSVRSMRVR